MFIKYCPLQHGGLGCERFARLVIARQLGRMRRVSALGVMAYVVQRSVRVVIDQQSSVLLVLAMVKAALRKRQVCK